MAIAATIEWEARDTGTPNNVNGGGFNTASGGVDYSQQDTAQLTNTDGSATGTTTFTSPGSTFTSQMVGNLLNITAATGLTVGRYEIKTFTDANNVVLDRTPGTGTVATFYVGGALSLGHTTDDSVFESMEPGNIMHIKSGAYTLGSAIAMAKDGTGALPITVRGYETSRNDNPISAGRPTLAFGTNTSLFGDYVTLEHIIFTTQSALGINTSISGSAKNCKSTNSSGTAGRNAFTMTTDGILLDCQGSSTSGNAVQFTGSAAGMKVKGCYLHDSDTGIDIAGLDRNTILLNTIDTVVAAGIKIGNGGNANIIELNTIYGAATPAGSSRGIYFVATTGTNNLVENNIISGFVTGIDSAAVVTSNIFRFNALHNNTTNYVNVTAGEGSITTDPQFVSPGTDNFAVGANMKAAGSPGLSPGSGSTGYLDIGAIQRVEPVPAPIAPIRGTGLTSY